MDEEGLINAILKAQDENDDDPQAQSLQVGLQVSMDDLQDVLDLQYLEDARKNDEDFESACSDASNVADESAGPEPVSGPDDPVRLNYPDESIPLEYPSSMSPMDDFLMAFALWCVLFDVSRVVYMALLQVLRLLLKDPAVPARLLDILDKLPNTIATLKTQLRSRLPLIELRSKNVALNPEKLPTVRHRKAEFIIRAKDQANTSSACDADVTFEQDMYFFNPVSLFQTILSSSFVSRMHFGMAVLVDNPTAFWHSPAWAQSIRATSGEFARFSRSVEFPMTSGKPLFPSDFVQYRCTSAEYCNCQSGDLTKLHWGRVCEVWREGRSGRDPGIKINISPVLPLRDILNAGVVAERNLSMADQRTRGFPQEPYNQECEYVILIRPIDQVPEGNVVTTMPSHIRLHLDLTYGSSVQDLPGDPSINASSMQWPNVLIRRTFDIPDLTFSPLVHMDPIAGELEIATYGRQCLEDNFAGNSAVKCIPTTTFNDGFGLYRHMHKSIEGIYIFLGNLQPTEGNWQVNVFPLTLGPHGSNPKEVVEAIRPYWATLEEGLSMSINGEKTFVCAFNLAFRADMPQQQDNSGMLRQLANRGCRECDVSKVERVYVSPKWFQPPRRRSHCEVDRQRQYMESMRTIRQKATYGTTIGMATERSPLEMWSPAADIIRTRPSDAAHSEFAGITKMTHLLLIDQV